MSSIGDSKHAIRVLFVCLLLAGCASPGARQAPCPLFNLSSAMAPQMLHSQDELLQKLRLAPSRDLSRLQTIRQMFKAAGCQRPSQHDVPSRRGINLSCRTGSQQQKTIVVGAHYDKVSEGRGVADNWSGSILLPVLFEQMNQQDTRYIFQFVAFGFEEEEMLGSRAFVGQLEKNAVTPVVAMINLDTLGMKPVVVDPRSDRKLYCLVQQLARERNIPIAGRRYLHEISGDWEPFKKDGIPILNLHSLDRRGLEVIHSKRDRISAVNFDVYYQTYQLISELLLQLDALI